MPISITQDNLNEEDIDLLIEEIVNEEKFEIRNLVEENDTIEELK